jgi:LysR family transcriptional regulator (chromosome initiation inhibitor)
MNIERLRALATAVDTGALDTAARRLHITPSAMSQRIRALEAEVGTVLLRRSAPVAPTEAGQVVLRAARQMLLIEADTLARIGAGAPDTGGDAGGAGRPSGTEAPVRIRLAVNADSLSTWMGPLFASAAAWPDVLIHLEVVDQALAHEYLAAGRVMAAISSRRAAGTGCRSIPLGAMRYRAMARVDLLRAHGVEVGPVGGVESGPAVRPADWLRRLPMVNFGSDDDLQWEFLRRNGIRTEPPVHQIPSSREFTGAVIAGLGWGMVPEAHLGAGDAPGTGESGGGDALHDLPVADPITGVPLYLHRWKVGTPRLDRVCQAITDLAATALR